MTRTRLIAAGVIAHREMSDEDKLDLHLTESGLNVRIVNTLENQGIHTVGELLHSTKDELLEIANFGEKTLKEVYRVLENLGFRREPNQTEDEPEE